MGALSRWPARAAATVFAIAIFAATGTAAFAASAASTVSAADTTWMIVATAFVLMMTIPGLALF
jgi:Amt family ammonium transporter